MNKVERILFVELNRNMNLFVKNLQGMFYETNEEQLTAHKHYGGEAYSYMVKIVNELGRMNKEKINQDLNELKQQLKEQDANKPKR